MRVFITFLVLIFSFQSWTKADDISDFEIEGMSIGDSALNFFNEDLLKKQTKHDWYDTKKFTVISDLVIPSFQVYDTVTLVVKFNDPKYTIESVNGAKFYSNNIDECYKELDKITLEIKSLIKGITEKDKFTFKHFHDKTGKSTVTEVTLVSKIGEEVSIQCYDWSDRITKEENWSDHLRITLDTKEWSAYLRKIQAQ